MAGRLFPVQVGDVEVLVEAAPVAGSEYTSRVSDAAGHVVDAFDTAEAAMVGLARRVAAVVGDTGADVVRPSSLQVEFGLKFSAEGRVIVAGASAEASLRVTVRYDSGARSGRQAESTPASGAEPQPPSERNG